MATSLTATYQDSWLENVKMKKVLYLITMNTYSANGPLLSCSTYLPNYVYGVQILSGDTKGISIDYVPGSENGPDLGKLFCRWVVSTTDLTANTEVSSGVNLASVVNVYAMVYGY